MSVVSAGVNGFNFFRIIGIGIGQSVNVGSEHDNRALIAAADINNQTMAAYAGANGKSHIFKFVLNILRSFNFLSGQLSKLVQFCPVLNSFLE